MVFENYGLWLGVGTNGDLLGHLRSGEDRKPLASRVRGPWLRACGLAEPDAGLHFSFRHWST